ncbi:MAG TPA: hypothetical protein VK930_07325 [Verrucomicrobiae bacterium]|jgi:hypothetical protein|nr:hypothetical protein [Verrucomicrobiae bacterium]
MEWLCSCGKPVTILGLLWKWRDASAIGQKHGRNVCYGCRIGCGDCIQQQADPSYQYVPVKLTAHTKRDLVGQILAEVVGKGLLGYLPRNDLQKALRSVRKGI